MTMNAVAQRQFDESVDHERQTSRTRQRAHLGPAANMAADTRMTVAT